MKSFLFFICALSSSFASFDYFPGNGKEHHAENGTIRLLTWNILGLRNDMVAVRPWEERIDGMAELILSSGADVVILQECFEKGLSKGLYERLKGAFPHIYLHLKEEVLPMASGLALFSKVPVEKFRFTQHPDLLDSERKSRMGTIDFLLVDKEKKPIAHIAGGHFQGSSNCEWRVGLTEDGRRLSYPEVRAQEVEAALKLLAKPEKIPSYLCGDLNVDRRSPEYYTSKLNPQINFQVLDSMSPELRVQGTNTNFWKVEAGLARMYSSLTADQVLQLSLAFKTFVEKTLSVYLFKEPLQKKIADFHGSMLQQLKSNFHLSAEEEKIWKYFQLAATMAIAQEKQLWKENKNPGEAPPVSIGRVIEVRVLPIEESLDYILGTNQEAIVSDVRLLQGYEDSSFSRTLSDHHPLLATLKVIEAERASKK